MGNWMIGWNEKMGEEEEKRTIGKNEFKPKLTLYFKSNVRCEYNVDIATTKILIEDCHHSTFYLNHKINTEILEFWKCSNCTIHVQNGCKVKTLQVDLCQNSRFVFQKKTLFGQMIWSSSSAIEMQIENIVFCTGSEKIRCNDREYPDYNEDIDQFIIRLLRGKLKEEQVIRLSNGFPTTTREADEFDRIKERNDRLYENHIRSLLFSRKVGAHEQLQQCSKVSSKMKRNDQCGCGSGMKFKKCCERLEMHRIEDRLRENKDAIAESEKLKIEQTKEIQTIAFLACFVT